MNALLRKLLTAVGLLDAFLDHKQKPYIAQNAQTARLWQSKIAEYKAGQIPELTPKALRPELVGKPIIWQYWGQGFDEPLPDMVRLCFASVDRHKGEYEVIRLSDATVGDYLQLPEYVAERLQGGNGYTRTFYSDLLRVALLATYGGAWLDATIYLTGELPPYTTEGDFFMYQRSDAEPLKHQRYFRGSYYAYWGWQKDFKVRCLNAFITAQANSPMIVRLYSLLLSYWQTEAEVKDYFFFQVLFNELVDAFGENCEIVSDCLPHLLGASLCDSEAYISTAEALRQTPIHKLNSKGEDLPKMLNYLYSIQ